MRNLIVAAVVLGVGGYFGAKFYVQYKTAKDLDAMLAQVRPFVDIEYDDVVATMDGELRVEDVTVRMPQFADSFTVGSVGLQTPGFLFLLGFDRRALDVPERLGIVLRGIRVGTDADFLRAVEDLHAAQVKPAVDLTEADKCASSAGFTPGALRRLGYHQVVADLRMSYRRDGSKLVMSIGTNIENMYDVDVEFALDGVQDPTAMARGAKPLFAGGRMDYVDRSLNDRIMKYCAEKQVTAEDVIAVQLRDAHDLARQAGMELDALIIQPYTDFLLGKQRFSLIAQPPKPVDLTRLSLYKPSDVPNLLNLTAEAG